MTQICHACGQKVETPNRRGRKAQDAKHWPPTMTAEQIEQAIDDLCGCAGRWDCNCISVFNRVRSDAWYRHNTKGGPA